MIDNDDFIASLKRDKARGYLAPHQIILLISFFNLGKEKLNIDELIKAFDENWKKYAYLFNSKNRNIGLPLKALSNKGLVIMYLLQPIDNFRNVNELIEKVKSISFSDELISFLKKVNLEYLESRISN